MATGRESKYRSRRSLATHPLQLEDTTGVGHQAAQRRAASTARLPGSAQQGPARQESVWAGRVICYSKPEPLFARSQHGRVAIGAGRFPPALRAGLASTATYRQASRILAGLAK